MVFNINLFLEKFKNLTPPDDFLRVQIVEAAREVAGVAIRKEDVRIQNRIVFITTTPIAKNELYIKKTALLERLKTLAPKGEIVDIR